MAANASRNRCLLVSSIFLIVSPVAVMESVRSFRCVVRNCMPRLQLVELIDGHHVDGTHALDLLAQARDVLFGRSRSGNGRLGDHCGALFPFFGFLIGRLDTSFETRSSAACCRSATTSSSVI